MSGAPNSYYLLITVLDLVRFSMVQCGQSLLGVLLKKPMTASNHEHFERWGLILFLGQLIGFLPSTVCTGPKRIILLVPPLFIERNSHSYNRTIFVFACATVPY